MTQDKYTIIIDAMYHKDIKNELGETKTILVYREDLPEDIKESLFNLQMDLSDSGCVGFEQSYGIMNDALALFDGVEFKDLEDFDPMEIDTEIASIYYTEQLGYLNTGNMYAIADLVREYELGDVASACAMWYDATVKDWAISIKNYILEKD